MSAAKILYILPGKLALQPFSDDLVENLKRINSPILHTLRIVHEVFSARELPGQPLPVSERIECIRERLVREVKLTGADKAQTIFIFCNPPERVRELFKSGRKKFDATVQAEIASNLHPIQIERALWVCCGAFIQNLAVNGKGGV